MIDKMTHKAAHLLAAGFMALAMPAGAEEASHTLTGHPRVIDGDSLELNNTKIRLIGVDACEIKQTSKMGYRKWHCGLRAKNWLTQQVAYGVTCTWTKTDVYGRVLATCSTPRGGDIGANGITAGHMLVYRHRGKPTVPSYVPLEQEAKAKRRGIWNTEFESPASYRAAKK